MFLQLKTLKKQTVMLAIGFLRHALRLHVSLLSVGCSMHITSEQVIMCCLLYNVVVMSNTFPELNT